MVCDMTAMTATSRNKVVLITALTAAVLGTAGLVVLALPAGAGEQPVLPEISAQELLTSTLSAQPPAMHGTVELSNALGLPPLPGLPRQATDGSFQARVWHDGDGRSRLSLPANQGERTLIHDGTTLWQWDSANRTATKLTHPTQGGPRLDGVDPATAAGQLLQLVRPSSVIAVDGTARVADRAAYELVLSPAPTERTLLREVRVSIDAQTRVPLRLRVLANGSDDPVFSVGFSSFATGPQDASLFQFSLPPGAKVTEPDASGHDDENGPLGGVRPELVGDGWDTVLVATLPDGMLDRMPNSADARAFLDFIGTPVEGTWGSGRLISTAVVSAIITDDGRIAAGAVPQQVLIEALSR